MAKRLDQVIVIDLEATCWEGPPPPGEENEIIEVGLCLVDVASGERGERWDLLVRPERSRVSDFCTRLTALTPEQVAGGVSFAEACRQITTRYAAKDRAWASYGDYDRRQFERQCQAASVPYPFGPTHLNVKTLFALRHGLPREVGMTEALARLQRPLEGTHHRAGDDAWNTAGILSDLLRP